MATPDPLDLAAARRRGVGRSPKAHQHVALQKLAAWYDAAPPGPKGGILVLPTGGGKTFTAWHFLCRHPLSAGAKVLWLAHTHHLLVQAYESLTPLLGLIADKPELRVRVVSGTPGHFKVASIDPADDVVIGSLQTVCNAVTNRHPAFDGFLDSAEGKLFVVFDEAHHSPAPSYRRMLQALRDRCPRMSLLGLTATPTYTDESKRGWLTKLFPQGVIHQAQAHELMAAGVLARPVFEEAPTEFDAGFDEQDYDDWVGTNRDLPESVITSLATSRTRNETIVNWYASQLDKYGQTIIFADRWEQCLQLCELLVARGVTADAIFSHVDADPGSAADRNRRTASENAEVLRRFKAGGLQVLVNIRMATEGTDVPGVQTVFLTRQTTSQILLTQMVGRALRGPELGGTETAHIVSFIDDWKHRINWAAFEALPAGPTDEEETRRSLRRPLQLVSIELVRRLARQMDSGVNVSPAPYQSFLPVGWYRVGYDTRAAGGDDVTPVDRMVMVFDGDREAYGRFVAAIRHQVLDDFEDEALRLADVRERVHRWRDEFFAADGFRVGDGLAEDLFSVARHLGQNDRQEPPFYPFEARDAHDLDAIAREHISRDTGHRAIATALKAEYARQDRYWSLIYPTELRFKSEYDGCVNRLLAADEPLPPPPTFKPNSAPAEPDDATKAAVKARDHHQCLCCGSRNRLQVDHSKSQYYGGGHGMENLQTLCKGCNATDAKGTQEIRFRAHQTQLPAAPARLPDLKTPPGEDAKNPDEWGMFLRRTVNLFYQCAAVQSVEIGQRGERFRTWRVRLFPGNDPAWLAPHLPALAERVRAARKAAGYEAAPDEITVTG